MSQLQPSTSMDPHELSKHWMTLWAEMSAPINELLKSQVATAFLQDSSETFNKLLGFWASRPEEFGERTACWANDFNRLFSEIDSNSSDPKELESAIRKIQASMAEKAEAFIDDEEAPLSPEERKRLRFNLRQLISMSAPQNAFCGNLEVFARASESSGSSLIKGATQYQEDLKASDYGLQVSRSDKSEFVLGENLAATAGSVVFRNELIQLIHYEPIAEKCFSRPLLFVPPCINRFYILDLLPENSMVGWLLEQGHDVYMISWVNPDASYANTSFNDYLNHGVLAALSAVLALSKEKKANLVGYCIGGLMAALATASNQGQKSVASLTLLTTLLDYSDPGELSLFTSPRMLDALTKEVDDKGFLGADIMSTVFTFLREEQLFWSHVRRRYYLGEELSSDALMFWGQDATHLPAKMAVEYLAQFYRDNCLSSDHGYVFDGEVIQLSDCAIPKYVVACKGDHIAPARAVLDSARLMGGDIAAVEVSGGHVLGVVNPPAAKKGHYQPVGEEPMHKGSWWTHWQEWLTDFAGNKVESRPCDNKDYPSIEKAPGSFVRL